MVGQTFHVFSLETKLLTFSSMLKNITEKFQKVLLKDLSLWKYPFLCTLPPCSNWLKQSSALKFCNAIAQVSKGSQHSTLRQCPAARVFCLTKYCRKLFFNSQLHHLRTRYNLLFYLHTWYERMIDNFWCLFSVSILTFLLMLFLILLLVYKSRIDWKLRG